MHDDRPGTQGAADSGADAPSDDSWLDVPNCADCLLPMEARETDAGSPYWACPACGRTRIA